MLEVIFVVFCRLPALAETFYSPLCSIVVQPVEAFCMHLVSGNVHSSAREKRATTKVLGSAPAPNDKVYCRSDTWPAVMPPTRLKWQNPVKKYY